MQQTQNNPASSSGASEDLLSYDSQLKAILSQDSVSPDQLPTIATLLLKILEKVKDIYQVHPALVMVSDFLSAYQGKVPQLFATRPDLAASIIKYTSSPILHVPAYNFKTRNTVFQIYQQFMVNKLTQHLENQEAMFVASVLSGIDEEKDPRNLLLTYDLIYFIMKEHGGKKSFILPFIDEIFDKISCYFPINFQPPKNDKYQITPDILKEKLARCFLSSPLLAPSAFPFILDKLTAQQTETKLECLGLLRDMFSFEHGYCQGSEARYVEVVQGHCGVAVGLMVNEYFNMVDDNCKRVTAETLALVLKRQSDHQLSKGISLSGTTEDGKASQLAEILEKCYKEVNDSPESVTAFFACDLLSIILINTNKSLSHYILQRFLVERIVDPLIEGVDEHMHHDHVHSEMGRQAAFVQIVTNLAGKVAEGKEPNALLFFEQISVKLLAIVDKGITQYDIKNVIFEKSLKLLATLSQFPNFEQILNQTGQSELKLQKYAGIFAQIFKSSPSQVVLSVVGEQLEKLMASKYLRVSEIIQEQMQTLITLEKIRQGDIVTLSLLNFGILTNLYTVELCLQVLDNSTLKEEVMLAIQKPIMGFKTESQEENLNVQNMIVQTLQRLTKTSQLKLLMGKLTSSEHINQVLNWLFTFGNQEVQLDLLCYAVKTYPFINGDVATHLAQEVQQLFGPRVGYEASYKYGKLLFLLDLKNAKNLPQESASDALPFRLFRLYALILRGNQQGYTQLKNLVISEKDETFPHLFGQIFTKPRDAYLTEKARNFAPIFKLYKQRLFSTLYPVVFELAHSMDEGTPACKQKHSKSVQIMMHLCSLVSLGHLQDKLHELIPIAEQAIQLEDSQGSVKLTALQLFRKILLVDGGVQGNHLESFLPFILSSLSQPTTDSVFKVESLHTLTQIALQYGKGVIKKGHIERVTKAITPLLDDRKRAVRKFARTCINEWQTQGVTAGQ
ncbi:hypothetical protein FGO68_gene12695 [Halteria grandinella]|uniref:MMS19 nucleotide excision repair protein n=1 Tax=Halteria grandinella TaxID=5974 RepID=A0A8J8P1C8_HALGN|nr:hypothetical protein FGO68_gene12695 [Halteria grandinella]